MHQTREKYWQSVNITSIFRLQLSRAGEGDATNRQQGEHIPACGHLLARPISNFTIYIHGHPRLPSSR